MQVVRKPLVAKRYTISLPDDLAERIEPYKNQLSFSAIMQKSLESELAALLRPEAERFKATALRRAAERFYEQELTILVKGVDAFLDHLIDLAIQDNDPYVFRLYRELQASDTEQLGHELREQVGFFCEKYTEEEHPTMDHQTHMALYASYMSDGGTLEDIVPESRQWNDSDLVRCIKLRLNEKLNCILGEQAVKTYLTTGSGYPDWYHPNEHHASG